MKNKVQYHNEPIEARIVKDFLPRPEHKKSKRIIFRTHNLGVPLDHLNRDDIYGDPKGIDET